ncbi:uncharacterized protein [Aristolochia californica]|uniref:uncharacterized protein n=1 Tax=Aristolochia californica TaxID=171875 RepID=UPI0035D79215
MDHGDEWFALDKLYHILFCFFISVSAAALSNQSRYPFLRRWSIWIGNLISLAAGAAKEVGDEIGLWKSSGASFKDAIADLMGVLIASLVLSIWKIFCVKAVPDHFHGVLMV